MNLGPLKDRSKLTKGWKKNLDKAGTLAVALVGVAVIGVTVALTSVQPVQEEAAGTETPQAPTVTVTPTPKPNKPVGGNANVIKPPQIVFQNPVEETKVMTGHITESLVFNDTLQQWSTHQGIDLECAAGSEVCAAMTGTVVSAQSDALWGNVVVLRHSGELQTLYAGLESMEELKVGDQVLKGEKIGTVGNTAITEANMGNHLHFEVLKNNKSVDPEDYITGLTK